MKNVDLLFVVEANQNLAKRIMAIFFLLVTLTALCHAGAIVVSNDEWMWGDRWINTGDGAQFAQNVAGWLTGGTGSLLILSDNFGLTGSLLNSELTGLGYTVTVTTTIPNTLVGYTAVYVGGYAVPASLLTSYVASGGNVLLEAGTGDFGGAAGEAAQWNPFLNNFGLGLSTVYNGICPAPAPLGGMGGFQTQLPNGPQLFNGVSALVVCTGNDVVPFGNNPNVQIWYLGNDGLYGACRGCSTTTPEPVSVLLFGTGLVASIGLVRKKLL